jgi:hypothetical protein
LDLHYSTSLLIGLKKFNRYDSTICNCDPGFYLPVLRVGKTGKILVVNGQWSIVNGEAFRYWRMTQNRPFTIHH